MPKTEISIEAADLEKLKGEFQETRTRRARLDQALAPIQSQLEANAENARGLKKKLALGDATAGASLDRIEAEDKNLNRRAEGLRSEIEPLMATEIRLKRQVDELQNRIDQEERERNYNRDLQTRCTTLRQQVSEFLELYDQACQKVGEIQISCHQLIERFEYKGMQEVDRLVNKPLQNPLMELINVKHYEHPRTGIRREFTIRGLLPPERASLRATNGNGRH
jgi:chromosome segregation ATPase